MTDGKNSKYSQEQKKLVLELYEKGIRLKNIPEKTGVSYSSAQRIIRSAYPAEKQQQDDSSEFKSSYGLNPYIIKLKKRLKPGDKICAEGFKGEVTQIYKDFFIVQGKFYRESFTYTNFLFRKGRIL